MDSSCHVLTIKAVLKNTNETQGYTWLCSNHVAPENFGKAVACKVNTSFVNIAYQSSTLTS